MEDAGNSKCSEIHLKEALYVLFLMTRGPLSSQIVLFSGIQMYTNLESVSSLFTLVYI